MGKTGVYLPVASAGGFLGKPSPEEGWSKVGYLTSIIDRSPEQFVSQITDAPPTGAITLIS